MVSTGLLLASSAWLWGSNWWIPDLFANLASQLALVAGLAFVIALVLRRWVILLFLALAIASGLAGPLTQPRLAENWSSDHDDLLVSILVFNGSSAGLDDADAAFQMLTHHDPDILVLIEPSTELLDLIRGSQEFTTRYPYRRLPDSASAGWRVVFTRWPHRGGEGFTQGPNEAAHQGMHVMVVDRPIGAFGFVQFNPESPRTLARFRRGNQRVLDAIDAVNGRLKPLGIPILAAGDMNATPTGWRSRVFASRTGLRRAKPAAVLDGTFPAWAPQPLRIAIDDVWGSPETALSSWSYLPSCGSDHRAALFTILVPGQAPIGDAAEEREPAPSSSP